MAGSRSKRHNYLGMVLDYSTKDAVKFTTYDYTKNMIAERPPVINGESRTKASVHLYEVNNEASKFS